MLTAPPVNPFAKRETHSTVSITTYKVLTILSWLLSVIVSVYYVAYTPHDGFKIRKNIWDLNYLYPTAFTLNAVITDIYWSVFPGALPPPHCRRVPD